LEQGSFQDSIGPDSTQQKSPAHSVITRKMSKKEATQKWVPENRGQEIVQTEGWLGQEGGIFGLVEEPKKWSKPEERVISPNSSASKLNTEWVGSGFGDSMSSIDRPPPIKIEASRSIKDNPFLKNNR